MIMPLEIRVGGSIQDPTDDEDARYIHEYIDAYRAEDE